MFFVIARGYRYQLDIRHERPSRQPCHPRHPDSSICHRTLSLTHQHTFSGYRRTLSGQIHYRDALSAMFRFPASRRQHRVFLSYRHHQMLTFDFLNLRGIILPPQFLHWELLHIYREGILCECSLSFVLRSH